MAVLVDGLVSDRPVAVNETPPPPDDRPSAEVVHMKDFGQVMNRIGMGR